MALPLGGAVRLLRALGLPLAPETCPSSSVSGPAAGLQATEVPLPAGNSSSEDFELAPYPSPCREILTSQRHDDYTSTTTTALDFTFPSSTPLLLRRIDRDYNTPNSSRSASPAPSTCSARSTDSWSDSDSSALVPGHRGRDTTKTRSSRSRRKGAKKSPEQEEQLEALWRRYWD